jgi:hypothetical protein
MPMSAERVVELCNLSVNAINEDTALLEAGPLNGVRRRNSTSLASSFSGMRAVVSRLQEIIDGCGCDCIGARATG